VRATDDIEHNSGSPPTFRLWHDLCVMRASRAAGGALAAALLASVPMAGCGSQEKPDAGAARARSSGAPAESASAVPAESVSAESVSAESAGAAPAESAVAHALALDGARTRPIGVGMRFRPPPFGVAVQGRRVVAGLRCESHNGSWYGAHVELFAEGHEIAVPAGIGIAPPQLRQRGSVASGGCEYPLRTADPTGVVLVRTSTSPAPATLGELFALWGQPLGPRRLASFLARRGGDVTAFVNGRKVGGDPRSIELRPHAQIVLEVGGYVQPHPAYLFAPGV
jgi:hypothetical protein